MTLTQAPASYSSVNNDLLWMFYDANAVDPAKTDYKYVAEVHIGGNLVHTERVFPRPDTGHGVFNFSALIRSYIVPTYGFTAASIAAKTMASGEFHIAVQVKVREEYDGSVGAVVLTDSSRTFFNHYDGRANGAAVWLSSYQNKLATTRQRTIRMPFSCPRFFLPAFRSTSAAFNVEVTAQDAAVITPSYTPAANDMRVLNIAPAAVNGHTPGHIAETDTRYTLEIDGETVEVELVCEGLYQNYFLHFLGQSGGWETAMFNKVRRRSKEYEKKEFKQPSYRLSGSGYSYASSSVPHAQRTVYAKTWKEKIRLTTDWLTDQDHEWLETLTQSPLVYLDDGTNVHPVVIANTNYDTKEWITDRIAPVVIDVEFTGTYNAQYQ